MPLVFRKISYSLLIAVFLTPTVQAQTGVIGYWSSLFTEDFEERLPGPWAGDYAGLPVNDAHRLRADTWMSSLLTIPEHQCKPHPSTYGFRGIGTLRISEEIDPETQAIISLKTHISWQAQKRTIWMDGRSHPDEMAPHSWGGFSTGHWEGATLVVETSHLKAGWIRRNGLALSDEATMYERFLRHGDMITHVSIITDPVYLTEPFMRTNGFQLMSRASMDAYPCRPAVEVVRERGKVPHHELGDQAASQEFANFYKIPLEAARGGAHTALPEFMSILEEFK
jgi:hypothetical protein